MENITNYLFISWRLQLWPRKIPRLLEH